MVTLAFAQMFYFLFHDTKFGGGSDGISMNFKPVAAIGRFVPFDLANATSLYYFVFAAADGVPVPAGVVTLDVRPGAAGHPQQRTPHVVARLSGVSLQARELRPCRGAGGARRLFVGDAIRFRQPELLSWHQSATC
jgi:hypothetical protein